MAPPVSKKVRPREHPSRPGWTPVEEAPPWKDEAWRAVQHLARQRVKFTADDLIDLVGVPDAGHEANSANSAVGPVLSRASKAGLIEAVGITKSRQPSRRGGMVRVWRGVR